MTEIVRALLVVASTVASILALQPVAVDDSSSGVGTAAQAGRASFVSAKYGPRYLALPDAPRGTLVRVTGPGGSVRRVSTDVGPDQGVFPDRVADLSYSDFEVVCGPRAHERGLGTCAVTVEWIGGRTLTPPPTDT
jgi:hypothetical protein